MKEYEIVSVMAEGYSNRYAKMLEAIVSAITYKHFDMLKIEVVRSKLDEVYHAIELKARFDSLNSKANGKLTCDKICFELNAHKFETLDEVEKALDNKAFL